VCQALNFPAKSQSVTYGAVAAGVGVEEHTFWNVYRGADILCSRYRLVLIL
jgi:hypothetical protein